MIGKKQIDCDPKITRSLSPVSVWAFSFGCAVGWGAFMMPGTTFLPLAGPVGTALGVLVGAAIMLIIGANYHYMINHYPDSGGTFSYTKEILGYDHGFLSAWFLSLVYISIAWANATALPLIFRRLFGGIFQFGFHYQIAGYDVFLGEALLSIAAMCFFYGVCYFGGKLPAVIQTVCAGVLIGGITIGLLWVMVTGHLTLSSINPAFSPSKHSVLGIINIVALAPWAFVGFESVSHLTEEYTFSPKKAFRIMFVALLAAAFCYISLNFIAVSVHPEGYSGWAEHISDLDNLQGTASAPVFYAVSALMGKPGIIVFCLTLLGALFTGILGNSFALSRLILSMSRDGMMPRWFGKSDGKIIPRNIFPFLMLISLPIPFLGRSVIGWVIDINTIGAAIVYAYTSIAAFRTANREDNLLFRFTGIVGVACSVFFFMYFMLPNFSAVTTLSTESYMILVVWSILGFVFFRYIFHRDDEWRFGNSTVVWIFLLFLIFLTTTLWTKQASHHTTEIVINNMAEHHVQEFEQHGIERPEHEQEITEGFLKDQMGIVNRALMTNSMIQMGLILVSLAILFSLYSSIVSRQKKASEELLKAKSDFLANMSHEIRTPINTILGMDEMIIRESGESEIKKYASDIQHAGTMLISLINDVLDFSRIEAGKLELMPDEYDLSLLISDLSDNMRIRAKKKGIALEINVDSNMPYVLYGDNIRLRQILINLLTNAIKYTEEGKAVLTLTGTKVDEENIIIHVSVKDTGIGIREEDLKRLFVAFERLDEGRNRTVEGTGLGMNIVKQLLDLMGSRLEVKSVYGEGSEFSFDVKQKVLDWTPMGDFEEKSHERDSELENTYMVSFIAPDARVLLVDDTEMNLLVIKGLLKNTRLVIDTAEDGKEALELTEKNEYDLLLIDHRMPVMDGVEMLKTLRASDTNPNRSKTCICVTANAGAGAREEYLKAGFDDYIIKPVNGSRLEATLIEHLPPEKVDRGRAARSEVNVDIKEEEVVCESAENESLNGLKESGINTDDGVEYAGSMDMYIMALQFFRDTADRKCDEIIGYYDSEDWNNYTIKVHGLKSAARVIGAAGLSENARQLELAGKADDLDYIHANHEALIEEYKSFKEILKDI